MNVRPQRKRASAAKVVTVPQCVKAIGHAKEKFVVKVTGRVLKGKFAATAIGRDRKVLRATANAGQMRVPIHAQMRAQMRAQMHDLMRVVPMHRDRMHRVMAKPAVPPLVARMPN